MIILRLLVFTPWILWQILAASGAVLATALSPGQVGHPAIMRYPMRASTDLEITLLSWAITVTPGTLVTSIEADAVYVHAIHGSDRDQLMADIKVAEDKVLWLLGGKSHV